MKENLINDSADVINNITSTLIASTYQLLGASAYFCTLPTIAFDVGIRNGVSC
jgi:hypothetical protein